MNQGATELTSAWYLRSLLIFPVSKSHTSTRPSLAPDTRNWPSGENTEHSACDLAANCT